MALKNKFMIEPTIFVICAIFYMYYRRMQWLQYKRKIIEMERTDFFFLFFLFNFYLKQTVYVDIIFLSKCCTKFLIYFHLLIENIKQFKKYFMENNGSNGGEKQSIIENSRCFCYRHQSSPKVQYLLIVR